MAEAKAETRHEERKLPLSISRNHIIRIWLVGAGLPLLVLIVQSILGNYGSELGDVWGWFIPTVMPTIALMIGVLGGTAIESDEQRTVRKSFHEVAVWLSIGYLSVLLLTILLRPFSPTKGVELYSLSNYWLSPLQGLVVAALGYLFTSEANRSSVPKESATS